MSIEKIIEYLLGAKDTELFACSSDIRGEKLGTKVYLRGLIEITNRCSCNCFYCGIRKGNKCVKRYELSDNEVLDAARFAYQNGWGSVVIQGGEIHSKKFVEKIATLCKKIKELSDHKLAITLSLGQHSPSTYALWRDAGANRYLLRIETTNEALFKQIHPSEVSFTERKSAIESLLSLDYQVGSGIMIGLPGQGIEDIARDLVWLQNSGVVMCGMGPYIPNLLTPMTTTPYSVQSRVELTLRSIAILRLLLPNINIAASTALGTLDSTAQPLAMKIGANVLMPNITPISYAQKYALYQGKVSNLDLSPYDLSLHTSGTSLAYHP